MLTSHLHTHTHHAFLASGVFTKFEDYFIALMKQSSILPCVISVLFLLMANSMMNFLTGCDFYIRSLMAENAFKP